MELAARHSPDRDSNKLSILRVILDVVNDNEDISKVQRGI